MKNRIYIVAVICALILAGCSYDNYDEPTSVLSGRVVYDGQALGVKTDGTGLSLWQDGYAFKTVIPVKIAYDGSFSAVLFDGEYKLTRNTGGPWKDQPKDTVLITVKGNTIVDIPVIPYFTIRDVSFQYSGGKIVAKFKVDKVDERATLTRVTLCVGKSILTDYNKKEGNTTYSEAEDLAKVILGQEATMVADIPANLANGEYVYARVGVRAAESASAEFVYSLPVKVATK